MVDKLTRDRPDGTKLSVEEILINAYKNNDKEILLIKVIDRFHNLNTVSYLSPEKQKKQAYETIKNFLICTEELSLNYMSQFFYGECIKLNLKLGVITLNSITEKQNIFDEEFSLPVSPLYQNV
jgi:(p)ppGpp synthase/HD superfamily hydrolase